MAEWYLWYGGAPACSQIASGKFLHAHVQARYRYQSTTAAASSSSSHHSRPRTAGDDISEVLRWNSQHSLTDQTSLSRTVSSGQTYSSAHTFSSQHDSHRAMDAARLKTASISSSSSQSTGKDDVPPIQVPNPFMMRNGRRYLRDLPYPFPCDLAELQRQNLQTLLSTSVFGKALCSPLATGQNGPVKVLELACGSGYWSSLCHDYFVGLGKPRATFVGLDALPLAPDMRKQGMDWRFVQHDLRKNPLPFENEEFDIVMLKDLSVVVPLGIPSQKLVDESVRILKRGGMLEIWDHDHIIRSLLPHPPPPPGKRTEDDECARSTATFLIYPGTPFAPAQNKYLQDSNGWIQEALDRRKLSPTPCARVLQILLQEVDTLTDVGYRRLAIPLGELRWEGSALERPVKGQRKPGDASALTEEQAALRYTALLSVVQKIESMEPMLKDVSGKSQEEWQRWWAWMMADLLVNRCASSGECLEVGAWWSRKV